MKKYLRPWLAFTLIAIVILAVSARLVVNRLTREKTNFDSTNFTRIEEGLYVGGAVEEPPPGTQAVLNLCEKRDSYENDVQVHRWKAIRDSSPAPTIDWLREQVEFVDVQRKAGMQTYIHCRAGVSRSGMVVTAYLMSKNGWSRDRAIEYVRKERQINPNPAFMELLLEWEKIVKEKKS